MSTALSRVEGVEKALNQLNKTIKEVKGATEQSLIRIGLLIMRGAMERVPVDTGALRMSAFVVWKDGKAGGGALPGGAGRSNKEKLRLSEEAQNSVAYLVGKKAEAAHARIPTVFVGFGASYAIFVHENLRATYQVGEHFFLENAIFTLLDDIPMLIKEEIEGRL